MKSYRLIHELITLVEELEQENPGREVNMHDFAGLLLKMTVSPPERSATDRSATDRSTTDRSTTDRSTTVRSHDARFGVNEIAAQEIAFQLDNSIGQLLVYMSRYAKSYIKKALDGTSLLTAEDFTALAILLTHDHLSKTELINYNLQEKTSGTEVIKRLLAAGLIEQWNDEKDRRSRQVAITEEGKKLLYAVFQDMNHVGQIISGKLTHSEKLTLRYLLQKLEDFHYEHYENKTIRSKSDLQRLAETLAIASL